MIDVPAPGPAATPLAGLKVAMATTGHKPMDDRIFFKEARTLARAGAAVTILHSDAFDRPDGRDGVVFQTFVGGGSLRRRARTLERLVATLDYGTFDVIHCHEPDALLAALRLKNRSRVKVIFDSHEMWGAVLAGRMPQRLWRSVEAGFKLIERRWLARCDAAIGASWDITNYLSDVLGPSRVATILNVPVAEVFGEDERPKPARTPMVVCHDGMMTFGRGLKTMAEAVRLVSLDCPIRFRIVGDVFNEERAWLENFIAKHALADVIERTGWLPYAHVGQALAPCHVGLIALQRTPNNVVTSSNKVFNYLLYGMPFIGPEFRHSKQQMVREDGCGLLADSADPTSYAAAIRTLMDDEPLYEALSARALHASRTKYRWDQMEPRLIDLYLGVLGARDDADGKRRHV